MSAEAADELTPLRPGDTRLADLLALNNAHAEALSWLDPARLDHLLSQAFFAAAPRSSEALLVAFDQDAAYDSPNFLWFRARFDRFVYVDRVVVAARTRGGGLARRLYAAVGRAAAEAGHDHLVCEVNLDPPNPASDAFHDALGFAEAGRGQAPGGKLVRYLHRGLPLAPACAGG